jgi:choline dehydrogenase-like flavoprotein
LDGSRVENRTKEEHCHVPRAKNIRGG